MKKNLFIGLLTILLTTAFSFAGRAQIVNTKKNVVIPAGKTSVSYKGRISDLRSQQIYTIKLRKGQIIHVLLTSKNRLTTFNMFNSTDYEAINSPQGETQEIDHVAEKTDNYQIIVTINEPDKTDDYVLTFKIKDKLE